MMMNATVDRLILIVEDEPDVARLIAFHLQRRSFRTAVVQDGAAALEFLAKHRPDLVILDVLLPGLDGFEVCWQIKAEPTIRDIPVIFLTALGAPADKLRGFGCGAEDYLTKPFAMSELIVRVYALLRRRGGGEVPAEPTATVETTTVA